MKKQTLLPLNDDVVFEKIQPWLPPKSLLKFRSVSKSWYSAISDPYFIAKHQSHFGDNYNCFILLLLFSQKHSLKLRQVPEQQNQNLPAGLVEEDIWLPEDFAKASSSRYGIMASCNGLFCYASHTESRYASRIGLDDDDRIYLCNPSIRWTRAVLPFTFSVGFPRYSTYGAGFDRSTNDYKVIMLARNAFSGTIKAALYSVKANSWKRLNNVPESPIHVYGMSIFLHGFVHWLSYSTQSYKDNKIVLFDVGNEVFGEMKLPAGNVDFDGLRHMISISVVRGSLCHLGAERFDGNRVCCHMWMMKEYGVMESWTKHGVIEFELLDIKRPSEVLHVYTQATVGGKIICSIKKYGEFSHYENVLFDPQTVQYIKLGRTHNHRELVSIVPSLEHLDVIM